MILLDLSLLLLAAWVWLAVVRLAALRTLPSLGPTPDLAASPGIVAVIPARDEEQTIGACIGALFASEYPGELSIIVVDDHSTDGTAEIARETAVFFSALPLAGEGPGVRDCQQGTLLASTAPHPARFARHPLPQAGEGENRLSLIPAPPLAAGWTGKLNAVQAGVDHAATFAPDARYVLLTDADIVLAPETLRKLVAKAEDSGAALVSLMARLDARGVWGGLLVPAFVFFFQKLYPFQRVNDARDKIAAAAGGCMLVRREALDAIGGVAAIKDRLIDDCALAAAIKQAGRKIWIGLAKDEAVSLRDNRSLASIWRMVKRSAFTQLDHSYALLAGTVAGMLLLYVAPPAIALGFPWHQQATAAVVALLAWVVMSLAYFPTARVYDQAPLKTLLLPVAAFLYTLMTIHSALDHARGRGGAWKGRTYPA